jgi:hypothetical protein
MWMESNLEKNECDRIFMPDNQLQQTQQNKQAGDRETKHWEILDVHLELSLRCLKRLMVKCPAVRH